MKCILRFAGIHVPDGAWHPLTVQRRFFYCLAAAAAVGFFGFGGVFILVGSRPSFCKICHIMEPYYESWRTSQHGKRGVECLQCHAAPGAQGMGKVKFPASSQVAADATGTYGTRLHAEIPDSACLRPGCHEKRLLDGRVDFNGVHFDHKPHLTETRRGKQLRCQTCHSQIVQGAHLTVTESVCFTCHFKGFRYDDPTAQPTANCSGCHEVPAKAITLATGAKFSHQDYVGRLQVKCVMCHADSVQGTGDVPRQVCIACHSKTEDLEKRDDPAFLHQTHVSDHNVECFYCHSEIRHGKNVQHGGEESLCGQCHGGLHEKVALLYRGQGSREVKGQPSAMSAASVQCGACHEGQAAGHLPLAAGAGTPADVQCVACHGDAVDGMLASWKDEAAKMLGDTRKRVEEAAARLAQLPDSPEKETGAKLLAEAREDLDFAVSAGPVHNLEYASSILENVRLKAAKVAQAVAKE